MFFSQPKYRVIITGVPVTDYAFIKNSISNFIESKAASLLEPTFYISTIITRGLTSTDKLAERFAKEDKIPCVAYSTKWDKPDTTEAMSSLRDIEMSKYADAVIAFDSGTCAATKHIVDIMRDRGKEVYVVPV